MLGRKKLFDTIKALIVDAIERGKSSKEATTRCEIMFSCVHNRTCTVSDMMNRFANVRRKATEQS